MTEETGTPDAYEADDAVDSSEPEALDFEGVPDAVVQLLASYHDQIQYLTDRVEELSAPDEAPEEAAAYEVAALPEGARRYVHTQFTEALLIRVPGDKVMQNGSIVHIRQQGVEFQNGLYTSTDEEEQEWIENHPDFLTGAIYRDDSARPGPVMPGLVEGVRGTEPISTARSVLSAQMQ